MNFYDSRGQSLEELNLTAPQMAEALEAFSRVEEHSSQYESYEDAFRAFLYSDVNMVDR